jgi:hypothetical protein
MMLTRVRNHGLLLGCLLTAALAVSGCDDDSAPGKGAGPMDASNGGSADAGADQGQGTAGAGGSTGGAGGVAGSGGGTGGTNAGGAGGTGAADGSAPADASDATVTDVSAETGADTATAPDAGAMDGGNDASASADAAADVAVDVAPAIPNTCANATSVDDGTLLENELLHLATQNGGGQCSPDNPGPTLYYKATLEAFQRLTIHAYSIEGERDWTPSVRVFTQCDQGQCPSRGGAGRTADDGTVLHYANKTDGDQTVFIEVSAIGAPVEDATFAMEVSVEDSGENTECDSPEEVTDGDILRDQFLAAGTGTAELSGLCALTGTTPALFYYVEIPANKSLKVTTRPWEVNLTTPPLRMMVLNDACDVSTACATSNTLTVPNTTNGVQAIVFAVAGTGSSPILFDLDVSFVPAN